MTAPALAVALPASGDPEGAFRYVLKHLTEAVDALTWLSQGLDEHDPTTAQHVRRLAADLARRRGECLQAWPS